MLRHIDSCGDHYSYAQITRKWDAIGTGGQGSSSISSGNGRRSSNCIRFTNWSHPTWKVFDQQGTWIVGFAFKHDAHPSGNRHLVGVLDGSSHQCCVRFNLDGTVSAVRGDGGGTVLATSVATFPISIFDYYEVKFVVHNTTGSIEVRKNGTTILTTGATNTRGGTANNSGATIAFLHQGGTVGSAGLDLDDVYICDGQGSANNDFLGDCRVDATFPNAEASTIEFTPSTGTDNSALVDDNPSNDDTDYVSSSTPGDHDLYDFPAIAPTAGSVFGVAVHITARKDDAGVREIRDKIRQGGTTYDGTTVGISTSYDMYTEIHEEDPDTSAPWTIAGVNSAEFGVELVS